MTGASKTTEAPQSGYEMQFEDMAVQAVIDMTAVLVANLRAFTRLERQLLRPEATAHVEQHAADIAGTALDALFTWPRAPR